MVFEASGVAPLTVSALTAQVQSAIEGRFFSCYVQGEIANFRLQSSGHSYFTLQDKNAQMQVAFFKGYRMKCPHNLADGQTVRVQGAISIYPPRGTYQLIAHTVEPVGLGEKLAQLAALKQRLSALGWFAKERKKKLPFLPRKIGVITSPTGAVIRDIIHVLRRRYPGFHLQIAPVRVQGEEAAKEITDAIKMFNAADSCAVIILARGGGSFEDLMPFNDEQLLAAMHASRLPIIAAIGHETDYTLADFVADVRAPTPSAAAELVLPEQATLFAKLQTYRQHLIDALKRHLRPWQERHRWSIRSLEHRMHYHCMQKAKQCDAYWQQMQRILHIAVERKKQRLTFVQRTVQALSPKIDIEKKRKRAVQVASILRVRLRGFFEAKVRAYAPFRSFLQLKKGWYRKSKFWQETLAQMRQTLQLCDPQAPLKKGFALVYSGESLVRKGEEIAIGAHLRIAWQQAEAEVEVKKMMRGTRHDR